ncbi:hypothetical protein [uncultured Thiothrix sp.]|jgi:hypothetical protein|uniref:hypothetical protein n=1 Tax=uncultured Thiothrix sp. TaxID=223185 RepID=UPI00261F9721|nr:hypothetical protein [uncultured Thiothrix sp.]HMT93900.1 hypothetical protein [Thiolinea sp.]
MNTSTAQACAHTDRDELEREFIEVCLASSEVNKFITRVFVHAAANKDTAPLHELVKRFPRDKKIKDAVLGLIAHIEQADAVQEVQA